MNRLSATSLTADSVSSLEDLGLAPDSAAWVCQEIWSLGGKVDATPELLQA